jgi:hypothetical protein
MKQFADVAAVAVAAVVCCLCFVAAPAAAQDAKEQSGQPQRPAQTPADGSDERTQVAQEKPPVRYTPPRRGSPRAKIGGGVRGATTPPRPLTLAPPHLALTTRSAPVLFWYLEALPQADARTHFTLTSLTAVDPVVDRELGVPQATGIQRVDLEAMGVVLEPETEYQWSISIVRNPQRRELDLVDSSYLVRVAATGPSDEATTADWAARSVWYEALASAMAAVEADPASDAAQGDLAALLHQAGLHAAIP